MGPSRPSQGGERSISRSLQRLPRRRSPVSQRGLRSIRGYAAGDLGSASLRLGRSHRYLAVLVHLHDVSIRTARSNAAHQRLSRHDDCVGVAVRLDFVPFLRSCLQEGVESILPSPDPMDLFSQLRLSFEALTVPGGRRAPRCRRISTARVAEAAPADVAWSEPELAWLPALRWARLDSNQGPTDYEFPFQSFGRVRLCWRIGSRPPLIPFSSSNRFGRLR